MEELRELYQSLLVPDFNRKEVKKWKEKVYNLKMIRSQRDLIWEYLNGDIIVIDFEFDIEECAKMLKEIQWK